MLIQNSNTTLILQKEKEYIISYNINELTTTEFIDIVEKIMIANGYHPVSIFNAMEAKLEDMKEYFDVIVNSKEDWDKTLEINKEEFEVSNDKIN